MDESKLFIWNFFSSSEEKLCRYQFVIRYPFFQFSGFFQNILDQCEAVFPEEGRCLEAILLCVAGNDLFDRFHIGFLKLRRDDLGDFCGAVFLHIVLSFFDASMKDCSSSLFLERNSFVVL